MAASPRRTRVTCVWRAAAAGGQQVLKGGATRSCAYRSPCGQWCSCCSACGTQGVQAVVVQVQLRRGRPRRPLLATFVQRAPCAALGDAAGAQGRRRASVQHAACHVVDGFKAVGCGLSSGEGGLCSLSSPCSIRGLSVVRCRCPRAVCRRVVDGSERWRYGFSSGEGGLSGLSSPHSFERSVGCTRRRLTAPSAAVADGAERVSIVGDGALPSSLCTAPEALMCVYAWTHLLQRRAAVQASGACERRDCVGAAPSVGAACRGVTMLIRSMGADRMPFWLPPYRTWHGSE